MSRSPLTLARPGLAAVLLAASCMALSGCAVIGDIFKAGVWVGVILVVGVVALIGGGIAMMRR